MLSFLSVRLFHVTASLLPLCCQMTLVVCTLSSCPSAQEGMPFVLDLDCVGLGNSDEVYWEIVSTSSVEQNIACTYYPDTDAPPCGADNRNVTVTSTKKETFFVSYLNFTKVTAWDRNAIVTCIVVSNTLKSGNNAVRNCKMDVFYKPEAPQCTAVKPGFNSVNFNCTTSRVYPHLKCQVVQQELQSKNCTDIREGFHYSQVIRNDSGITYYRSSCAIEIYNVQPGRYRYFGLLTPAVGYDKYVRNMSVPVLPTPSVTIFEPNVTIHLPENWRPYACPDSPETFHITCRASKFDSHPSFEWYIGTTLKDKNFGVKTLKEEFDYISTFKFPALPEYHGKSIECRATSSGFTARARIDFGGQGLASYSPKFVSQPDRIVNDTLVITDGTEATVTCHVDRGNTSAISSTHVQCRNGGDDFVNLQNSSNAVTFTLNGTMSFNTAHCKCSASHGECYTWISVLYFAVTPKRRLTHINASFKSRIDPKAYILAGIVGYIFCTLLIALILFFLCRWQKAGGGSRYLPVFRSGKTSQTRRHTSEHEYEIVR